MKGLVLVWFMISATHFNSLNSEIVFQFKNLTNDQLTTQVRLDNEVAGLKRDQKHLQEEFRQLKILNEEQAEQVSYKTVLVTINS